MIAKQKGRNERLVSAMRFCVGNLDYIHSAIWDGMEMLVYKCTQENALHITWHRLDGN